MTGSILPLDPAAHKAADVLLPWFVNGTLQGDEFEFVQSHVSRCTICQREAEWLRELHTAVAGEADPETSRALRQLRGRLEAPRRPGVAARLQNLWDRARPWSLWVIAAELAVVIAMGTVWLPAAERPALYRTLSAGDGKAPGNLVVVFDPATTEADLRRIVRGAGARIVDGPTQANAYVLEVPEPQKNQAMQALRSEHAAVLVEQLGPQGTR